MSKIILCTYLFSKKLHGLWTRLNSWSRLQLTFNLWSWGTSEKSVLHFNKSIANAGRAKTNSPRSDCGSAWFESWSCVYLPTWPTKQAAKRVGPWILHVSIWKLLKQCGIGYLRNFTNFRMEVECSKAIPLKTFRNILNLSLNRIKRRTSF